MIRTLIAEDEPLARRGITALLARVPDIEVVGAVGDGVAAVDAIRTLNPELVLLDVEMPELNGLGVVSTIGAAHMPVVVFITAFDRFAAQAFDLNAIDYIVKPFTDHRFFRAIERVKQNLRQKEVQRLGSRLAGLLQMLGSEAASIAGLTAAPAPLPPATPAATHASPAEPHASPAEPHASPYAAAESSRFLPVRSPGRTLFLPIDDIIWIEANGAYARIHTAERSYVVTESLGAITERLDPRRYIRPHRSAVVNTACVRELQSDGPTFHTLLLRNGVKVPLSRRRKAEVEVLLGLR